MDLILIVTSAFQVTFQVLPILSFTFDCAADLTNMEKKVLNLIE